MSESEAIVEQYMVAPVHTAHIDESLAAVDARLAQWGISSLAVIDGDNRLCGVISRTDLLDVGRPGDESTTLLRFPDKTTGAVMTTAVVTVSPDDTMRLAAKLMVERHIHRVYVTRDDALVGVLSTRDLMRVLADGRSRTPISAYMSQPVLTLDAEAPVSTGIDRTACAGVSGLVVVELDRPIGLFTQREALEARRLPPETPAEEAASPAMLCLESDTPIFRAAAQCAATRARRVIAVSHRQLDGVLTGIDFARALLDEA